MPKGKRKSSPALGDSSDDDRGGKKARSAKAWREIESTKKNGVELKVGDAILVNQDADKDAPPYIAKILKILEHAAHKEEMQLRVMWYYRPEEAYGGRQPFHGVSEVFASDHEDTILKSTILQKVMVHSLKEYQELEVGDLDFFSRFMYKAKKKEFEPDHVPVYCTCEMPYNPDKCMIMCEGCREWYHEDCVGPDEVERMRHNNTCQLCMTRLVPVGASMSMCASQGLVGYEH